MFHAKKQVSAQTWRDGELVTLEGSPAHPKSRDAMERALQAIAAGEVGAKAASKGKGKPAKQRAPPPAAAKGGEPLEKYGGWCLRRLQEFRYLCDVPYADVVLSDDAVAHAQAASELCAKLGHIDHEPPNPGLPEAEYRFGLAGTKHCNLGGPGADDDCVTGLMNDSDAHNIDRVGHRRWCLDPAMGITGFGRAGEPGRLFMAMWAMDKSRQPAPDYDAICYPARGWMPIEMFGLEHAWSVELSPLRFPRAPQSGVQVRIFRLDSRFVRAEKPLELEYFKIDVQDIAVPYCIIFRPKDLDLTDGAAYLVEISGVDPKAKKGGDLRYLVHFYSRPEAPKESDGEGK